MEGLEWIFCILLSFVGGLYAIVPIVLIELDGHYELNAAYAWICGVALAVTQKFVLDAIQGKAAGVLIGGAGMLAISVLFGMMVRDRSNKPFGFRNGAILAGLSMAVGVSCFLGLVHYLASPAGHAPVKVSI